MLLNCHTYYSFKYGTFSPEQLFNAVKINGYNACVLSDINNTSACLDALRKAPDLNLNIVPGIDFRNGVTQLYIGIAMNNEGFLELNQHLSNHLHQDLNFDIQAPQFLNAYVVYPFSSFKGFQLRDNEFIGVTVKDLVLLPLSPYRNLTHKMVVLHSVSFQNKAHFNAHRLLRSMDENLLLSLLDKGQQAQGDEMIMSKASLELAFKEYPSIIASTERLLGTCKVGFEFGKLANKNLKHYTRNQQGDFELLRNSCYENLYYRYPNPSQEVFNRIEKELEVIQQLNFASYFLINWDIVNYARRKNYYYVGRGSGANSILAYLLRITDVDPIELDLYFERFINLYRNNAPDFDMDFSWLDRDDITQ
ncbi:MAG: DNA polymerase III subunit alpha, partial [Bacteroidia bacterium]|nr:DNA polymerase III subunit alpha [Bacteroidia bacterium]